MRAWITSVFSLRKLRLTHSVGALVVVAASFFFLHDLGARALEKSDEALYAAGALEMARGGELVYPHQGFARYSLMGKPPGALWPSALSIAVFGRSPFAVRLPTALAGILSVFLVFLIVLKISESLGAALVAVFALLSQGGWLELGRIFWLENTLSAVFLVSVVVASGARTSLGKRRLFLQLLLGLLIGYATLVKHLVGFAALAALIAAEICIDPAVVVKPKQLLQRFGVIVAAAFAVFGTWLLCFILDQGSQNVVAQVGAKLAGESRNPRVLGDIVKAFSELSEPWFFFGATICLIVVLAFVLPRLQRQRRTDPDSTRVFLVLASALLLISHLLVFGTLSDKLRTWYLLPCVPVYAIFFGIVVGAGFSRCQHKLHALAFALVGVTVAWQSNDIIRWYSLATVVAILCIAWLLAYNVVQSCQRIMAPSLRVLRGFRSLCFGAFVVVFLGVGITRSYSKALREFPQDNYMYYQQRFAKNPPATIYIDAENFSRVNYYKPTMYFYFSPIMMTPIETKPSCDLTALKSGSFVILHRTVQHCMRNRARETRNLSPFWRINEIR